MKNVFKKFTAVFALILALTASFSFAGCKGKGLDSAEKINKNTTLELGFLEDVSKKDLSSLTPDLGWFGANGYYNSGYVEGDKYYVHYLITAYPDYADGGSVVTRIICTDPNVTFFDGCTVENCGALFDYLSDEGFVTVATDDDPSSATNASKGAITVSYFPLIKKIVFYYEVGNRNGIIF